MSDHGSAVSVFRPDGTIDADYDGEEITGVRVVLEDVAQTLMTDVGAIFYAPTEGVIHTLQSLINSTHDDAALRRIEDEYAAAAEEQCEGVVKAIFKFSRIEKGLRLTGRIYTDEGPGVLDVTATDALRVLFPDFTVTT